MDESWVQKAMQQIDVNGDNELTYVHQAPFMPFLHNYLTSFPLLHFPL